MGAGKHRQIESLACWFQVSLGRAVALSLLLRHLVEADALLCGSVEIGVVRPTQLDAGGHKGARQRVHAAQVGDVEGTTHPVIGRGAPFLVFRFFEVRQDIGVAPSRVAQGAPVVVVVAVASRIDHGIDGARSSQHLSPGYIDGALLQVFLLFGRVAPVVLASVEFTEGSRDVNFPCRVRSPTFKQ